MFKLELLELVNKYKKEHPNEKKDIEEKITSLIKENKEEFEKFVSSEEFDPQIKNLLDRCKENSQKKEIEKESEDSNDFVIIRHKYEKWLNFYTENNNVPDKNCEKIIEELIGFYIVDKFEILQEILKINDTQEYEVFKNMVRNMLRIYFTKKIKTYYESSEFKSLSFFKKRTKKIQIINLLGDIGKYKFNKQKIEEILK